MSPRALALFGMQHHTLDVMQHARRFPTMTYTCPTATLLVTYLLTDYASFMHLLGIEPVVGKHLRDIDLIVRHNFLGTLLGHPPFNPVNLTQQCLHQIISPLSVTVLSAVITMHLLIALECIGLCHRKESEKHPHVLKLCHQAYTAPWPQCQLVEVVNTIELSSVQLVNTRLPQYPYKVVEHTITIAVCSGSNLRQTRQMK